MKNIQVIDGANNCVYDIFACTDDEFAVIFPENTDIAFIDEVIARESKKKLRKVLTNLWTHRIKKADVQGIHGMLFYQLEYKKVFYPTRRDEEASIPYDYFKPGPPTEAADFSAQSHRRLTR